MMPMIRYEIVEATLEHATELGVWMCKPDMEEVWAAGHLTPREATRSSLLVSRDAWTGLADGQVVCMFGVGSPMICSTVGVPWLLATDQLQKHARPFLRRNRKMVRRMMGSYSILRNFVDARNTTSIRWLKWLGFKVLPPEPFGVDSLPFHPFEMRAQHV